MQIITVIWAQHPCLSSVTESFSSCISMTVAVLCVSVFGPTVLQTFKKYLLPRRVKSNSHHCLFGFLLVQFGLHRAVNWSKDAVVLLCSFPTTQRFVCRSLNACTLVFVVLISKCPTVSEPGRKLTVVVLVWLLVSRSNTGCVCYTLVVRCRCRSIK